MLVYWYRSIVTSYIDAALLAHLISEHGHAERVEKTLERGPDQALVGVVRRQARLQTRDQVADEAVGQAATAIA